MTIEFCGWMLYASLRRTLSPASGIAMLGEMLASNRRNNMVYYLRREQAIPKLATGGRRDKDIHLRTIKEILINNGAKTVEMFALGRAVRD